MTELVLHEAAANGDYHELESLVLMGKIDINFQDEEFGDRTALHWAAYKGQTRCVKLLLEHKADATVKMVGGWTPAHCAAEMGRLPVLKVMADFEAPVNIPDDTGDTPRRIAEIYSHKECVEFLEKTICCEKQKKLATKSKIKNAGRKISRVAKDAESMNKYYEFANQVGQTNNNEKNSRELILS